MQPNAWRPDLDFDFMAKLRRHLARIAGLVSLFAVLGVLVSPSVAHAAPVTGKYPAWTITPASSSAQNHSGTVTFGVTGMPDATYTVTKTANDLQSTSLRTGPSSGDWLTSATPFGALFGASNDPTSTQFINTRIDFSGFPPLGSIATTVVTFAAPVPANALGFAVGDIDVDMLEVTATKADSSVVNGSDIFGGTFNFCNVVIDRPTSCPSQLTFVPTWTPASGSTISGTVDGLDTERDGESAWFRPNTAIQTLTFRFSGHVGSGSPSYRLWLAVLKATISGTVDFGTCPTSAVQVQLIAPDGSTVLGTATTASDGTYAFPNVVAQPGYDVRLTAPINCEPVGPSNKPADVASEDKTVNFALQETPAPTTTTAPVPSDGGTSGGEVIANTGAGTAIEAGVGFTFVALGALFLYLARRRPAGV